MLVVVIGVGVGVGAVEDEADEFGLSLEQKVNGFAGDAGPGEAASHDEKGAIGFGGKGGGIIGGEDGAGVDDDEIELFAPESEGLGECGAKKGVAGVLDVGAAGEEVEGARGRRSVVRGRRSVGRGLWAVDGGRWTGAGGRIFGRLPS